MGILLMATDDLMSNNYYTITLGLFKFTLVISDVYLIW